MIIMSVLTTVRIGKCSQFELQIKVEKNQEKF